MYKRYLAVSPSLKNISIMPQPLFFSEQSELGVS